ncbi:patatin-like phospholipase family protein [Falsiroseomonas selenitidurans]|uniref:Patatin-like phospholipase family protein n=1 Tax=Falsiroseomonas selenitidurans TaxID=2716335 RepID=A0ABX1E288_9PROT|nr:patatin-like phospholipase family protein [Falsiroseomonas selenitidurans]NKC31173.1 patatin-like phospholipase family protein [Falsiroseomonas selenitidurans]
MNQTAPPVPPRKRIKLALQGGGAHGAFTWGVLDRLLQDDRLEVEGIVGTSAGAMNTVLLADGLAEGGPQQARATLRRFWERTGKLAAASPLQPSPLDRMRRPGTMATSPGWMVSDLMLRVFSPYQLNPANNNPLRDLVEELVDFERLRTTEGPAAFVCATNVLNGRLRVFERRELSAAAVMASACLPQLFQAVEVEGEPYWDGGYSGNPPIFPLIYMGGCADIIIVQLNPINIPAVPRDMRGIMDRINTLAFNSSLMREMRMIRFVTELIDRGDLDGARYMRVLVHTIDAEAELGAMDASSKLNADPAFLRHLFALGTARAEAFLARHWEDIGERSSTDVAAKFC